MSDKKLISPKQSLDALPLASFEEVIAKYDTEIDVAYNESLKESLATTVEEGDYGISGYVIFLDSIPELQREHRERQLMEKLAEYSTRVEQSWSENGPIDARITSSLYKRDILRLLLEHGEVDTWALTRAYNKLNGGVDRGRFSNACGVIEDYVVYGGSNVGHGTGLPSVE